MERLTAAGFVPWSRRCWSGGRRCSGPASCPPTSSRSSAPPTTTCTWPAPPRSRWSPTTATSCSTRRPCRCATPASRAASGARPAPTARTPGHLPGPPVRQGGDGVVRAPRGLGREHELLLAREEEILQALELPYRVVDIAAGDLGGSAARKFDCEAWIPSQGTWREPPRPRTAPTTRPAASAAGSKSATATAPRTPSTAPPWPSAAPSSPCSRTTSSPTARSGSRRLRAYLDTDLIKPAR